MRRLLTIAVALLATLCAADELRIVRYDHQTAEVLDICAEHPEQLMSCQSLDRARMRFYGLTDRVSLTSYLWGYWEEQPGEQQVYDQHTKAVDEAVNLGWGLFRLFSMDPSVTAGLSDEITEVLKVVEDPQNIRWCRPALRGQLFDFSRRMRAFKASVGD